MCSGVVDAWTESDNLPPCPTACSFRLPLGSLCKQALEAAARQLRREAKAAQGLVLKDELKSRRRALRRLGYVADEGVVTDKGALWSSRCSAPRSLCQASMRVELAVAPRNSTPSEALPQAARRNFRCNGNRGPVL